VHINAHWLLLHYLFLVNRLLDMASIQKQMLGTEVVPALRSKGYKGRICGLSANSMEQAFLTAGADAFMFKPFPCEPIPLQRELCRVLFSEHSEENV
jgi:CheY-like chemotaxis protein